MSHPMSNLRELLPLPADECWNRVRTTPVGRLGFCLEGRVHVLPVAHAVLDGRVVFRTGPGSKLAAAAQLDEVVYEVDGYEPAKRRGWSVAVRGTADLVTDPAELERLYALDLVAWVGDGPFHWVQIIPTDEISGRRIVA